MHLIGWLPQNLDDRLVSQMAAQQGIDVQSLSSYSKQKPERPGLLLGYAGVNDQEIREGIKILASVLRKLIRKPPL